MTFRCPIRGHDHDLRLVRVVVQRETDQLADILECPTGRYRWFRLHGRELSDSTRMTRPRYGWRNP